MAIAATQKKKKKKKKRKRSRFSPFFFPTRYDLDLDGETFDSSKNIVHIVSIVDMQMRASQNGRRRGIDQKKNHFGNHQIGLFFFSSNRAIVVVVVIFIFVLSLPK